jgi:phosphomannomutase
VGFVVDPDVDRLAVVCEDGSMFGEEYTLVAVADYVLSKTPGNTASNLSSTRALRDVTEGYGRNYFPSAVGEVNVVQVMKEHQCVIGGEGNGGVIYPELHYGRDALVGIALFLSHLAESGSACSELRDRYPAYTISKNKITLPDELDKDAIQQMASRWICPKAGSTCANRIQNLSSGYMPKLPPPERPKNWQMKPKKM